MCPNGGARDEVSAESCQAAIERCSVFLGILGPWYGSPFPDSERSYSEAEYDVASALGMTRLMFLSTDDFPIAANLIPPEEHWSKQKIFRANEWHLSGSARISNPPLASHCA